MKDKTVGWIFLASVFILPIGICAYLSWESDVYIPPPSVRYATPAQDVSNARLLRELRQANQRLDEIDQRQRDLETKTRFGR